MAALYKTPGVYIEEISTLPPSVAEVATAVPAFVGYTATGPADSADPLVVRIETMLDFTSTFGGARPVAFKVTAPAVAGGDPTVTMTSSPTGFSLYYAISHYFKNGGGPCYVVSVGNYQDKAAPNKARFSAGVAALEKEDEPTLIVLTDAAATLGATDYYALCGEALMQCRKLGDRFAILDVHQGDVTKFRNDSNLSANLMYGAAYHPYLQTSMSWEYADADITVARGATADVSGTLPLGGSNGIVVSFTGASGSTPLVAVTFAGSMIAFAIAGGTLTISGVKGSTANDVVAAWATFMAGAATAGFDIAKAGDGTAAIAAADVAETPVPLPAPATETLATVKSSDTSLYNKAAALLGNLYVTLPPSAAIAGIYARVDREQGVWKAPGNVGVLATIAPVAKITNDQQDNLNVDPTAGKSINAIRAFTGKGTLVWGARTLAGNDNEWRYVSVRRLFITIEESTRKATAFAVFEPNDSTTWLKVKAMIESYLYGLWERGALAGSKPESAYFVHVGLGKTMTPDDVLNGRMIVEIGVAAVRPAEFIVLRFSHKLQTE